MRAFVLIMLTIAMAVFACGMIFLEHLPEQTSPESPHAYTADGFYWVCPALADILPISENDISWRPRLRTAEL